MMRALTMTVVSAALGAGAIGAAVTLKPAVTSTESAVDHDRRPGPDSGRVAILLDALGKTDPVVCELLGDQIGNFWNSGERGGVGRLAATPASLQAAKDSIGGRITDPRAIDRLVSELSAPNPCVRHSSSINETTPATPGVAIDVPQNPPNDMFVVASDEKMNVSLVGGPSERPS